MPPIPMLVKSNPPTHDPSHNLRYQEQAHDNSPPNHPPHKIMPKGHKHKNGPYIQDSRAGTSHRNVHVPDDPEVEGTVPASPESHTRVVVSDASDHVFWWVDSVKEGNESEEPPDEKQLQPDYHQVVES